MCPCLSSCKASKLTPIDAILKSNVFCIIILYASDDIFKLTFSGESSGIQTDQASSFAAPGLNPKCFQRSRLVGKPKMWFPNRSDTNRAVQAQKMSRSLKFCI